jgi:hypothetical protein
MENRYTVASIFRVWNPYKDLAILCFGDYHVAVELQTADVASVRDGGGEAGFVNVSCAERISGARYTGHILLNLWIV